MYISSFFGYGKHLINLYFTIFNRQGDWYPDVDISDKYTFRSTLFESLAAFYPGLQVLLGELNPATRSENSFMNVREHLGFLPERFDYDEWSAMRGHDHHPLRPEIHESCYFIHMGMKGVKSNKNADRSTNATSSWLWSADFAVRELAMKTKTNCGYGVVSSVNTQPILPFSVIGSRFSLNNLQDEMPSFFLSETLKYFYLVFDSNNPLNVDKERDWIFTTEAHPIHHVPHIQVKPSIENKDPYHQIREKLSKKLKARLKSNERSRQVFELGLVYFNQYYKKEKWASSTSRFEYLRSLNQSQEVNHNSTNSQVDMLFFGRVLLKTNDTEKDFNFATAEHNKNGRGAALGHTCPNYHHQNSFWINALNGDQLEYTDLFVTRFHNEEDSSSISPALLSSALFGLPSPSTNANTCSVVYRKAKTKAGRYKTPSHSSPLGAQRIEMGLELGAFDISVLEGRGFFIQHVRSGESVEATIISNPGEDSLVVVESYVPDNGEKRKTKNLLLKSLGSSFTKLTSVFMRNKVVNVPTVFFTDITYERNALISDLQGRVIRCQVELIQVQSQSKNNKNNSGQEKNGNSLGLFPCLPATYGPTALQLLVKSDENIFEAELYGPNKNDKFGCSQNLEYSYSTEPRIEMVKRGKCNFRNKAVNIAYRNNVTATIVVNAEDKLFVMGGSEDDNYDNIDEPASILVTKDNGAEMIRTVEKLSTEDSKIKARIRLIPLNNNDNDENHQFWPLMRSTSNSVAILASQGWGVTAKLEKGQWALYVLKHDGGFSDEGAAT